MLHPHKSDDRCAQLTRGAFIINDFLQNPHFRMTRPNQSRINSNLICVTEIFYFTLKHHAPLKFGYHLPVLTKYVIEIAKTNFTRKVLILSLKKLIQESNSAGIPHCFPPEDIF